MNKVLYIILSILIIVLGGEGYILYQNYATTKEELKQNSDNINNETNNTNNETNNINNEEVSKDSILKLAQNEDLYIDTDIQTSLAITQNQYEDYEEIYLSYEDGGLYLVTNNHKVKVNNFTEKVVGIKDARNSCALEEDDILVLTSEGNVYKFASSCSGCDRYDDDFYKNFNNLNEINLDFVKVNNDTKVLAFTNYYGDFRGYSCGLGINHLYASDGKYYSYDNFVAATKIIKRMLPIGVSGVCDMLLDCGILVYKDNTISIDGENLLKDSDGNNIIYNDGYVDVNGLFYIMDKNNNLYIFELKRNESNYKIEYDMSRKKFKNFDKTGNNGVFTFDDDTTLEVEFQVIEDYFTY